MNSETPNCMTERNSFSTLTTSNTTMLKTIRITCTDPYATESSSDEESYSSSTHKKMRYMHEIRLQPPSSCEPINKERDHGKKKTEKLKASPGSSSMASSRGKKKTNKAKVPSHGSKKPASTTPEEKQKFRGVRLRKSGRWAAEITAGGKRYWLGTYKTAHEAAYVYDGAARRLRGPNTTTTNFRMPAPTILNNEG